MLTEIIVSACAKSIAFSQGEKKSVYACIYIKK